jgi:hypothetical protein
MKMTRNIMICVALILLSVPLVYGQDLSRYRNFSLGTSLADVSKQINERATDVDVIRQSPATIQQLEWRPVSLNILTESEPVQKVIFSFYDGKLYKIAATYDSNATAGLTAADMIGAISAAYGTAMKPVAEIGSRSDAVYSVAEAPIAQWGDAQYSVTLSRGSLSNTFQLVMFSKELNRQAEAAIAEAVKQESEDAPQRENVRLKKEADDLEATRQANLKTFRP